MPTSKEAIAEALQSLDHTKDDLWTDDGAPLVAVIQRMANDDKITRAQINDALPGFARKTKESVAEDQQPDDGKDEFGDPVSAQPAPASDPVTGIIAKVSVTTPPAPEDAPNLELSAEEDYERLRGIAKSRVDAAEVGVIEAKNKIAEAQSGLRAAEDRLTRALNLYSAKYPPISVAANIKQHLQRQQEMLHERVTGQKMPTGGGQNPIDMTLMDRKRDNGRNGKSKAAPAPFLPRQAAVRY